MESIFQSPQWEEFKLKTGYQKSYRIDDILVLQKNLPFGYSMLYSPMISRNEEQGTMGKDFVSQILEIAKQENSIFYRLELDTPTGSSLLVPRSFKKSFEEMQPESTLILDIAKSEDEILAQMKPKGRYNIKVAEKNGILISAQSSQKYLNHFYQLYSKTAERHSIGSRGKKYFEILLEIMKERGYAQIYQAAKEINGKEVVLASAIIIFSGDKAIYMFGASSNQHKNLMAPYLLHWVAIKDAKVNGYKKYDFFGIAPDDNPAHHWAGITRFKKQFGGEQINILGSYDLIFKPAVYRIFKLAERIRRQT